MKILFRILLTFILLTPVCAQTLSERIAKAGDSKAPLVTIFDSTFCDVQPSGLSYVTFHRLQKVLNAEGAKRLRTIVMDYDPLSAAVEIREVKVYNKDGILQRTLDVNAVQDYPAPARAIYWGARQKMLELGRLETGDAVEVTLFRKGFTYALLDGEEDDERFVPPMRGHFYDIVPFWSSTPVQEKVYQVLVPADKNLQYKVYNGALQSAVEFKGPKTLYSFAAKDIQPFKREANMVALSDEAPKLLLSTSPDWQAKSKWFYGVNEDYNSFEVTPEIQAKVNELLAGVSSEDEKISILTHWVADEMRYSGLSMGPGEGYTLHKGSINYRDRCGVCKDKAGLLITMLRAAGFESYPAMTMAGSRIDRIPADQFNHSVTVVKKSDGKYHLLDPTWVPFVRELWSSAEQQQQYLMGVPEGADLASTPISPPEKHYYKIEGNSELDRQGTLRGSFTLTAEGQSDARIRRMFTGRHKANWRPFLEAELLKQFPQMQIQKIEFNDGYDYRTPMRIKVIYEIPNYATITDKQILFTPVVASHIFNHSYINEHLFMDLSAESKVYQFRTRSSKQIVLKEVIKLPRFKKSLYLPQPQKVTGSGASFDGGYTLKGRKLVMTQTINFNKRIYDPQDWPSFRQAVENQKQLAAEPVILSR